MCTTKENFPSFACFVVNSLFQCQTNVHFLCYQEGNVIHVESESFFFQKFCFLYFHQKFCFLHFHQTCFLCFHQKFCFLHFHQKFCFIIKSSGFGQKLFSFINWSGIRNVVIKKNGLNIYYKICDYITCECCCIKYRIGEGVHRSGKKCSWR